MGYMPDERGIVRTVFGYTERDLRVYADQYTAALRTALEALRAEHETRTKCLFQMQEAAKDLARQVEALKRPLSDEDVRALFLANGFEIKPGHTDLKPYVYAAARALEAAHIEAAQAAKEN
jgi:hypothetical protein